MIKNIGLLALCCIMVVSSAISQGRTELNINKDWTYLGVPIENLDDLEEQQDWQAIDLPHTWNNEDVVDLTPGYRRSVSWYRKNLMFDKINPNTRQFLYFEGVNITTEVYVNGQLAGEHVGGYVGFEIEITKQIHAGENEILIKVDNGYDRQVIPSQKSDFFIYGGITRDVWLRTLAQTYIEDINISTSKVSKTAATTSVSLDLNGRVSSKMTVLLQVKNPEGKVVFEESKKAQSSTKFSFKLSHPQLWGVETPNLYTVEASLMNNNVASDHRSDRYGIRWFEFKDHGPFYLNGERLLLRGTHRHEEHAGYGAAMPNELHRRDIEMIKEMGANFIRLAHYPQDPEVYRACDELGILLWDELPWCRGGVGDEVWKANTSRLLKEMIDQNYNHPSIILWSMGNEIYWLPDFDNGDDEESINSYLKELNALAHQLDPSRKTSIRKYYPGAEIVDVFSPSIWSGWYSGSYKNYKNVVDQSIEKYNHFFHMEYGGSSHVGRHTENPINGDGLVNPDDWEEEVNQIEVKSIANAGDWSENYIVDLFDWYLSVSETHDQFVGNAQWAFKDFGTPLRPENDIPYMNQKGLVDREGKPKDAYYVYKSYWSKVPFSYIESHTWTERSGPKGTKRNISVFSNNEKVELFHNGKSLGMKTRDITQFPACGLNWDVLFDAGQNELHAVGYQGNQEVSSDSMTISYSFEQAGTPDDLRLSYVLQENGDYLVSATAVDKEGRRCLDYEERVYFQCMKGGELLRNQGTPTGSESIKMANGKASIIVKPDKLSSILQMTVLNQNFKGSFLEIKK
ncbi:glycoside hydrolase family 2 protein [Reichenbachiella agarivorans]|uniref:Glycoside hydrolase family 2 protein n=1 Tax=Reichenbachiella agarivorans TaxID=2979464 RepID=A0ABY6CSD9_9BACT|nr:glycoside hydrolase family 2 protein [Reichenbachiella agarivorans]UXP32774.1 glycoside hydrolase family 2 protein [Reichenbachiella agarivorans]